jgi:hypothetical protein
MRVFPDRTGTLSDAISVLTAMENAYPTIYEVEVDLDRSRRSEGVVEFAPIKNKKKKKEKKKKNGAVETQPSHIPTVPGAAEQIHAMRELTAAIELLRKEIEARMS